MSKKALCIIVVVMFVSVAAAGVSWAQGPMPPPGNDRPRTAPIIGPQTMMGPVPCVLSALRVLHPRMTPMLAARLSLSDEEKAKVLDLLTKADEALKPKIEAQKKAAEEFVNSLTKDGLDQAALIAAGENAMKAESAILAEKIKTLADLRAILTSRQKIELNKMLEQFSSPWKPRPPAEAQPVMPPAAPSTPPSESERRPPAPENK